MRGHPCLVSDFKGNVLDDIDDYQWLTNDTNTYWERKETIFMPSKYMQLKGHKATREEIVNLYKDKKINVL